MTLDQEELRNEILSIYKSNDGIKEKIDGLKGTFEDGDIIGVVEQLYDEDVLVVKADKGSGKEAFLSRGDSDSEVVTFWPESLEYQEKA